MFCNYSTDTEIADFDIPVFIQKDIIKFDIPMKDWPAMTMCNTEYNLLEYSPRFDLIKPTPFLYVLQ